MSLVPFVPNVSKVTDITNCGDERLFIVEQAGKIQVSDLYGNLKPQPFLNITDRVFDAGGEQGLLGLAFSPWYSFDHRFYVNYINNSGNTVISRFTASANPDIADSLSEEILFTVLQPFTNHNGGALQFGPDGFLYISLGDGGAGGDPMNNSQNLQSRLGKLLRINVNVPSGYSIPSSNPFTGLAGADPMIWSYGLRNAWRFSFDNLTGDKWIADVGQALWEEIDFQPANSTGGENYGWRCFEGFVNFDTSGCQPQSFYVNPVYAYYHQNACSVTGGYVYRGARNESWYGKYFFTDYCGGIIQSLAPNDTGGYDLQSYGSFGGFVFTTFGQDKYGELYIGKGSTGVFKLQDSTCAPVAFISSLDTIRAVGEHFELKTPYFPGFYYQWYFNDVLQPGITSNKFMAHHSGNYRVKVTSDSLCSNESKTLFLLLQSSETFEISPNPADEYADINWAMNFPGNKTIEVFDATGKLCEQAKLDGKAFTYRLNTTRYTNGIYVVRIIYNDQSYHAKLMVK